MTNMREVMQQALDAMRLAASSHDVLLLSDPPQEAWKARNVAGQLRAAITALEAALAESQPQPQPQPDPIAWRPSRYRDKFHANIGWFFGAPTEADIEHERKHGSGIDYAYAHPPQRQPLTDEEIIRIGIEARAVEGTNILPITFARALEKAHDIGGAT